MSQDIYARERRNRQQRELEPLPDPTPVDLLRKIELTPKSFGVFAFRRDRGNIRFLTPDKILEPQSDSSATQ